MTLDVTKILGSGWKVDYGPVTITASNQSQYEAALSEGACTELKSLAVKQAGTVSGMTMYAPPVGWQAAYASKTTSGSEAESDIVWIRPSDGKMWSVNTCVGGTSLISATKKSYFWIALLAAGALIWLAVKD